MNTPILVAVLVWFAGAMGIGQHSQNSQKFNSLAPQLDIAQQAPPSVDHRGSGRIYVDCATIVL